jgi:hypothetical protein
LNRAARRRHRRLPGLAGAALVLAGLALAAEPPDLALEHRLFSGAVSMRTPAGWVEEPVAGRPDAIDVIGDGLVFRVSYHASELPPDAFHAQCMLERQAPALQLDAEVNYEYDYVGGKVIGRDALDSAYRIRYDENVRGAREWRQRSLSLTGQGSSLCVVQMAPAREWKGKSRLRDLGAAVLSSIGLR